jgi:hypothetical protein
MPSILITSTPPGEAPLEIREAWVGVKLEISGDNDSSPQQYDVIGIRTRVDGVKWKLRNLLRRQHPNQEVWTGYAVELMPAIWALEKAGRNDAAIWWVKNVPHLLRPEQTFIFPSSSCRFLEEIDV